MMKKISILLTFLVVFSCSNISAQKKAPLFNGKNLNGWYAFGRKTGKHDNASEVFHVEKGVIHMCGTEAGYLMSDNSYGEFKLTAKFRWITDSTVVRCSKSINSGLMYLIPENAIDQFWPEGIQFQIKKGATGDFILLHKVTLEKNGQRSTAGKSANVKRTLDATKAIGEWNQLEINYKNGIITQKLNGKVVNEGKNPSIISGRIALMYEGFPIDFKDVKIKEY